MMRDAAFDAFDRGDWPEAEKLYRERLDRAAGPQEEEAAMHMLGFTLAMREAYGEARDLYGELLRRAEERTDRSAAAIAMHQFGMTFRLEGDPAGARKWFGKELEFRREHLTDDHSGFSANSYELGELHLQEGEPELALSAFRQALRQGKSAGDDICIGCAWRGIGKASQVMHHDPAVAWEMAIEAFKRAGDKAGEAEIRRLTGN